MLVLLLVVGGLLGASATPPGCSDFTQCMKYGKGRSGRRTSYEVCKSNLMKMFKDQALCFKDAHDRVLKDQNCQCSPAVVSAMYPFLSPSSQPGALHRYCFNREDALRPQCPADLRWKCQVIAQGIEPRKLLSPTCDAKTQKTKEELAGCVDYMRRADLSHCGSIQDLAATALPFADDFLQLICSGCDAKSVIMTCVGKSMEGPDSDLCSMKKTLENQMGCVRSELSSRKACSHAVELVDKLDFSLFKNIFEACDMETAMNYKEIYTSWGCKGGQGKRRTPLADDRRSTEDPLLDLWSAITEHF